MPNYRAPVQDMQFVITELAGLEQLAGLPGYEEVTPDLVEAVLEEAAKLAGDVLAPLNRPGDEQGAALTKDGVVAADGFAGAYTRFVENGWNGLSGDPEYGGQGLPGLIAAATVEMWNSANMSFALCPLLTAGATEALNAHGSDELKSRFLPKLVSGEWAGTMNLTEPQAGSDLSAVRTRAMPEGEHYRIFGQKIFITWGDHDMAENVVHLVLARLPDAPEGTRGISLFLVPKFLGGPGRFAGRAQRCAVRVDRAQARHSRQPDLRDELWREGGRGRLSGGPGERGSAAHVHDDERGPPKSRAAGSGDRRARLPGGA
jgi:3-(methylthio)propanoyl-CoA dehydrogenase